VEASPERSSDLGHEPILIVDDDVELCELLGEYLGREGYELSAVHTGPAGLQRALEGSFSLVILDVMLPVLDGYEVLRQLRRRTNVPVIMLTARAEERDRIAGLDEGADDYLVKPFAAAELLARIRAIKRRVADARPNLRRTLAVGDIHLNEATREASGSDGRLDLTDSEFAILELLMRAAGRVVSRDELAGVLYQREATPYERSVDVHVSHLRKKLEATNTAIRAVRGIGYVLSPTD
jgi:two-component system response regulator CpxR